MYPARWTGAPRNALLTGLAAFGLASVLGGLGSGVELIRVWVTEGWMCAAWLMSAFGLGAYAKERVFGRSPDGRALAFSIGIALQLVIDQWLGSLGVLCAMRGTIALGTFLPGWILAIRFLHRNCATHPMEETASMWWWPALGAVSALLVAASIPPGILWSTEFGGYDALEYHLQAPKEWLELGAIRPLEFLAYGGLPNFVEGGFLHLMCLTSDARDAALACQLLHASMMLVGAFVIAETASLLASGMGWNGRVARIGALCAGLSTPWLVVVGSLAYNESAVVLACACLLNIGARTTVPNRGTCLIGGLMMALLVGGKASSLVIVVPAVVAWFALRGGGACLNWRLVWRPAIWGAMALAIGMAPWIARNWTFAGAPFFPLATNLLGSGWWSEDQISRWNSAHASDASLPQRALALWNQFFVFGIGENPFPGEPWKLLWGPLPWIGIACLAGLSAWDGSRRIATALAMFALLVVVGWMGATHLQSRFLIPVAVPLSLAFGLCAARLIGGSEEGKENPGVAKGNLLRATFPLFMFAWACSPMWHLATDTPPATYFVGKNHLLQGDDDWRDLRGGDASLRAQVAENLTEALVLNHLHPEWRVLSIGWSAPFWARPDGSLTWSSVWDFNPIERCAGMPADETANILSKHYDALIIDMPMLERWKQSGWLSPRIDLDQLRELARTLPNLAKLRGGKLLLGLRGDAVLSLPGGE